MKSAVAVVASVLRGEDALPKAQAALEASLHHVENHEARRLILEGLRELDNHEDQMVLVANMVRVGHDLLKRRQEVD